jgi:phosphopantetheinyl transferase
VNGSTGSTGLIVTVWQACCAATGPPDTRAAHRRLTRAVLAHVAGVDLHDLRQATGPGGKPRLPRAPPAGDDASGDLHFNVSHTGPHLFVATCSGGPVGIDAEQVRPLHDPDAVAARALAPRERSALARLTRADRNAAVLRAWTRKEALLKGDGIGLGRPPASLEVDLDEAPAAGSPRARPLLHSAGWPWHLYDPDHRRRPVRRAGLWPVPGLPGPGGDPGRPR